MGLSTGGDAVNLFNGLGSRVTGISFGTSTTFKSFDNTAGLGGCQYAGTEHLDPQRRRRERGVPRTDVATPQSAPRSSEEERYDEPRIDFA